MSDLAMAWLGGAACYLGVLRSPSARLGPMPWHAAIALALIWPVVLVLTIGSGGGE